MLPSAFSIFAAMKPFLRILAYIKPYRNYAILNILLNLFAVLFSLVSITMIIPFLGILIGTVDPVQTLPEFSGSPAYFKDYLYYQITQIVQNKGQISALGFVCILVSASFFMRNFFRYFAQFFLAPLRQGIVRDIRQKVHTKVLQLPVSYFTEKRKGDIIARMSSDVVEIETSVISTLEVLVRDPLTIVTFTITLFAMSPELTLFVFLVFPIAGFIIGKIGRSLKRTSTKAQNQLGKILAMIEENVGGLRVIKAFKAEPLIDQSFGKENERYRTISVRMFRKRNLASPTSEFLSITTLSTVMWFGGKLVLEEQSLSPDVFMGYITLFSQMISPAKSLTSAFYSIQKGNAASDRIIEVLDAHNPIVDPVEPKSLDKLNQSIQFKDMYFGYGEKHVLKNINLEIPAGKSYALVGQSGSGKTSMTHLVPRFYDVDQGGVYLDGINVKDLKLDSLRGLIGMVTQDSILFHDSIARNIGLGKPDASMDEIQEAAKIANAHDFILELPEGYDTNIGDGGNRLSGGQKQRIAIARAVLVDPKILILDEATSALDTESERLVQDALEKLMKNRTSLVVAHRLSTVQHCDAIVVLHQGEIVEIGSHEELSQKPQGVYRKLLTMQNLE